MSFAQRPSWLQLVHEIRADVQARHPSSSSSQPDPWQAHLTALQGQVHKDGIERVATSVAFDHLGLPRPERTSAAARRLARVMRRLGWERSRYRVARGSFQRVRGFQRTRKLYVGDTATNGDEACLAMC